MLIPVLSPAGNCYKIHPDAGETSATFLKIPPGGRGISMGEAQVGIISDVFGMWWNPASIARIGRKEIGISYNKWFQGISKNFIGGVFPVYKEESIGIMIDSLIIKGDIERRTGEDEDDPYYPVTLPEGKFGAYDIMLGGVYARKLSSRLYGGISIKGIFQSIDKNEAYGIGADIGVQYTGITIKGKNLYIGASIRNFGTAIRFKKEAFNLPLDYNLGLGIRVTDDLLMALDFHKAIDNYLKIHTGFEYKIWSKLFLRTGYIYRLTGNPLGGLSGFRGGFGVKIKDFVLDYSYAPYSYLGESHRISFQAVFGKVPKKRLRKIPAESKVKKVAAKKDTFPESKELEIAVKLLSINPSSISWYVSCVKSAGVVRKIEYITAQESVENVKFNIAESTTAPAGFVVPSGKKVLNYINIQHNLVRNIKNSKIELVIEKVIDDIEVLDIYLNKMEVEKIASDTIRIKAGDRKKLIILGNE